MASTPSPSPHKPRRKAKKAGSDLANSSSATKDAPPSSSSRPAAAGRAGAPAVAPGRPAYPLAALLWPARGKGPVSQWESLPLILMAVGLFRWAAGMWGYSGECLRVLSEP
jgi:alpha-1,3-glucosyltransferase